MFVIQSVLSVPSLLAIETATNTCSVAVYKEQHVIIETSIRRPRVHAEQLIPITQEVLKYAELQVHNLDAIVISGGPGSYTGLRIGVSTAKGLAFSAHKPLIAVPSLDAMAYACLPHIPPKSHIIITRNARKDELYIAMYKKSSDRQTESMTPPQAVLHSELKAELNSIAPPGEPIYVAGEGTDSVLRLMESQNKIEIISIPMYSVSPSARAVALLGARYYDSKQFENVSSYEPLYLKDFIPKKRKTSIFDRLPF